jgi:hypothetical protein
MQLRNSSVATLVHYNHITVMEALRVAGLSGEVQDQEPALLPVHIVLGCQDSLAVFVENESIFDSFLFLRRRRFGELDEES